MSLPWIIAFALLTLCVLVTAALVLGTLRRISGVLEQAEVRLRDVTLMGGSGPAGLEPGASLPTFRAETLDRDLVTDADLRGAPAVLLFLSSDCPPCRALAHELRRRSDVGIHLYVVLGRIDEARELRLTGLENILLQGDGQLSQAFKTRATPHAFVFDAAGALVAAGTPNTYDHLRNLTRGVLEGGGDAPSRIPSQEFSAVRGAQNGS